MLPKVESTFASSDPAWAARNDAADCVLCNSHWIGSGGSSNGSRARSASQASSACAGVVLENVCT